MRRTVSLLVVGLLGVLMACAAPPPSTGAPVHKPTLLVYGDSLTTMSEPAMTSQYGGKYQIVYRASGGSAMCDWSGGAAADRRAYHPTRVVLAFTGNNHTCVTNDFAAGGLTAVVANYARALTEFHTAFAGLPTSVVAAPAMQSTWPSAWFPENGNAAFNQMYQRLCAQYRISYNADADNWLSPGHVFVWQRPRFGGGPLVTVRAIDGVHLTPDGEAWYAAALGA